MNNSYTANLIKNLCKEKGVSIKTVLEDCNIRSSLIHDMNKKNKTPSTEILEKIADYLDVSIDYLVGRINTAEKALPEDELNLLNAYREKKDMQDAVKKLLDI